MVGWKEPPWLPKERMEGKQPDDDKKDNHMSGGAFEKFHGTDNSSLATKSGHDQPPLKMLHNSGQ